MKILNCLTILLIFISFNSIYAQTFSISTDGIVSCTDCISGDKGTIDGVTYEAVDKSFLIQRITEGADLSKVVTTIVKDMSWLFEIGTIGEASYTFNEDISSWDVSNVTNMDDMFRGAYSFNQDIGNWDVSSVRSMARMFEGASAFNQDVGNWDVSNVTNISGMFSNASNASKFNQDISNWDVSSVTSMGGMFNGASAFNEDIGSWDVSNVTNMYSMFRDASVFNQDLSKWCVSKIPNYPPYFSVQSPLSANHMPKWGTCPATTTNISSYDNSSIPANYLLNQNYPNPFNPSTQIQFGLPKNSHVKVDVFDIKGQKIAELVDGQKNAGYHTIIFDANNLASGLYIYRLDIDGKVLSKKMLLIK